MNVIGIELKTRQELAEHYNLPAAQIILNEQVRALCLVMASELEAIKRDLHRLKTKGEIA